jgi:hypothetical protein
MAGRKDRPLPNAIAQGNHYASRWFPPGELPGWWRAELLRLDNRRRGGHSATVLNFPPGLNLLSNGSGKGKVAGKGASNMENVTSIEGHVLKVNGQLMLLVPLDSGNPELMETSPGISEICGEYLKIVIPEWLAGVLSIEEGDLVSIQNSDRKMEVEPEAASRVN